MLADRPPLNRCMTKTNRTRPSDRMSFLKQSNAAAEAERREGRTSLSRLISQWLIHNCRSLAPRNRTNKGRRGEYLHRPIILRGQGPSASAGEPRRMTGRRRQLLQSVLFAYRDGPSVTNKANPKCILRCFGVSLPKWETNCGNLLRCASRVRHRRAMRPRPSPDDHKESRLKNATGGGPHGGSPFLVGITKSQCAAMSNSSLIDGSLAL